jgi:antitoxin (DNA-binding transcriptional repressor) of toxin-antitoxin stability system
MTEQQLAMLLDRVQDGESVTAIISDMNLDQINEIKWLQANARAQMKAAKTEQRRRQENA